MKIGITYNLKSESDGACCGQFLADDAFEEFDTGQTIDAIAGVFEKNGHSAIRLGWGRQALFRLLSEDFDFVFNIAEGCCGRNREAQMPAALEMLQIPYSGSDPLTLSLALDKIAAKKVLESHGIPAPRYRVVKTLYDIGQADAYLKYPLFIKPAFEGSSKGIRANSKVDTKGQLSSRVEYLLKNYPQQPALVEEYINGGEFTVGILGNEKPRIVGIMQIKPKADGTKDFFYSLEVKRGWREKALYECPARISASLKSRIEAVAIDAFFAFGCRDISRVDLRVDDSGRVYFLEINPIPGLSPEYADIIIMARKMGWTYEGFITESLNCALARYGMAPAGLLRNNEHIRFCPDMG